ncbi:MAG: PRC-barrel domain-containing protein [Steroidobacteraceae bacterium]
MIRIFLPLICAALGFAIASCTQSQGPFGAAEAPASARPASNGTAAAAMPSPGQSSPASHDVLASTPLERRASTLIGMPVVSAKGNALGDVKDIIFDRRGRATHLVVAFGARLTAVPWDAALASIKKDRMVLDDAKLQGAPSFTPHSWPNLDDPTWSAATDIYWRRAVRPAIAAHAGMPIDSTSRQRAHRTRDGN